MSRAPRDPSLGRLAGTSDYVQVLVRINGRALVRDETGTAWVDSGRVHPSDAECLAGRFNDLLAKPPKADRNHV